MHSVAADMAICAMSVKQGAPLGRSRNRTQGKRRHHITMLRHPDLTTCIFINIPG